MFFGTQLGLAIRYSGAAKFPGLLAPVMRRHLLFVGLGLGNSLVALGGALEAERNGGFSQSMGIGAILVGLATLTLGESVIKARRHRDNLSLAENVAAVALGILIYSFSLQLLLALGVTFLDVRLTSALLLLGMLAWSGRHHSSAGKLF